MSMTLQKEEQVGHVYVVAVRLAEQASPQGVANCQCALFDQDLRKRKHRTHDESVNLSVCVARQD